MKLKILIGISLLISILLIPNLTFALINPAQVYCHALGYEYVVETTEEGEIGLCRFFTGQDVDAWKFLKGEVAQEFSYCSKQGYKIKTISDWDKCARLLSRECAVCVLEDGREIEVTELMGLSFEETICGDGTCGIPENFNSCPNDCPSGSFDSYCDKVKDGICDPDCEKEADPDCEKVREKDIQNFVIIGIVLIMVIGSIIFILTFLKKMKRRRKPEKKKKTNLSISTRPELFGNLVALPRICLGLLTAIMLNIFIFTYIIL